jgi:hypothetical protein
MRMIRIIIALTVLVINLVTVARAAPPDCDDLATCFPRLFGMPPFDNSELFEGEVRVLRSAYSEYIDAKQCREARVALGLYVSDLEIEEAKYFVRRAEQAVKRELGPALLDDLWSQVVATKRNRVVDKIVESPRITCVWRRGDAPDNGRIVKDF